MRLPEGTYTVVILTNFRKELANILLSIKKGDTKKSVQERLVLSGTTKWETNTSSSSYNAIPMWGEIKNLTIKSGMANTPVNLVRMLSKINVSLQGDALNQFELESIRLYNYNDRGSLIPVESNWDATNSIATAVSIPSGAQKPTNPVQSPFIYTGTDITTAKVSSMETIYTFESSQGNASSFGTNTCLVVGGQYKATGTTGYYRIDLANGNTYLPLLRNHQYNINITKVSSPGLSSPEDAFKTRQVDITANITAWNEAKLSDVIVDGQYMIGVSAPSFSFSKEQRTASSGDNKLTITTDYPKGWKIDKITDQTETGTATWLKTSSESSSNTGSTELRLLLDANTGSTSRKGIIHISAGRMVYKIIVEQTIDIAAYFVTAEVRNYYIKNGSTYSFRVFSNTDWNIKSVTQERSSGSGNLLALQAGDNLKVNTTGTANTTTGFELSFTTSASSITATGKVNIIIESPVLSEQNITINVGGYYPTIHSGWAGSNIYFDGSKLTFDGIGITTHQNYQGVYFMGGSLFGISPMGAYSTSTTLYPPTGGTTNGLAWTAIPRVDDTSITADRNRAYLYEVHDPNKSIGDICKYLTDKGWAPAGKWRMPTSSEFEESTNYSSFISGSNGTSNAAGTASFGSGRNRTDVTPNVFFTATGNRDYSNGALNGVGGGSYYWSSSPSGTYGYNLYFYNGGVNTSYTASRAYGFLVRCVRE